MWQNTSPKGLVKIVRLPERSGLIQARLAGLKVAQGDVIVVFDSHMEVNNDCDELGSCLQVRPGSPELLIGIVMVGAAFAVDRDYLMEIGAYDKGMKIWGGENLELAWRISMCGGRLLHIPCSRFGHIARGQPYSFPEDRHKTILFNYKRAIEVWMEPQHKKLVHRALPALKDIDPGDLRDRIALKEQLRCHNFSWYLENIHPDLFVYDKDVLAWGSVSFHLFLGDLAM
ncbi:polypeptide N-acetylgalactosaminyltransferase 1-like [Gigantopelta aegis]|uniref:polypeptide N-acetylgalactosaminyltransferase 1-like n=1 Tax=Gigantopelta aegis TaxID=1735272 RepID=UPI001B888968|nr:polypeptide N-acetylgalactosaminyltransferase 1-like [Gigantopelta aegis]